MKTYIVVDLGYGDAGKGTTIDFLSRLTPNTLVVRYNGGSQAAHNVVTAGGKHHTFAQFGSGTLVPGVGTYLSKYMWLEPLALLAENTGLERVGVTDALSRLFIDRNMQIVTPFHRAMTRIKENARTTKHGSCGIGMGEAVIDSLDGLVLTVESLGSRETSMRILKNIQEKKLEESRLLMKGLWDEEVDVLYDPQAPEICYELYKHLYDRASVIDGMTISNVDQVIFEGAGGILLDENYGFHPHTMWTTTTTENALKLWVEEATTLGIIRTFSTRHGHGPFVTEADLPFVDGYNTQNKWQGSFRNGTFDVVATRYALKANGGVDALVVTHTDEIYPYLCDAYVDIENCFYDAQKNELILPTKGDLDRQRTLTDALFECKPHIVDFNRPFIKEISDRLELPVFLESFGDKSCDKRILK